MSHFSVVYIIWNIIVLFGFRDGCCKKDISRITIPTSEMHDECLGWEFAILHFTSSQWVSVSSLITMELLPQLITVGRNGRQEPLTLLLFQQSAKYFPEVWFVDFVHHVCTVHLCGAVNRLLIWKYPRALSQEGWCSTCCPDHGQLEWPLCQQSLQMLIKMSQITSQHQDSTEHRKGLDCHHGNSSLV